MNKKLIWVGRIFTALPAFIFIMSAYMKLSHAPQAVEGFQKIGLSLDVLNALGILELSCLIIYLIPITSVLGAVLLTGYLGGAIMTHLLMGQSFATPLVVGLVVWGGIYFREPRLHALLPIRKK